MGLEAGFLRGGIVTEIRRAVCDIHQHLEPTFPILSAHNFALLALITLRSEDRAINGMIDARSELELSYHPGKHFHCFYYLETSDEWRLFIRKNPTIAWDPHDE